MFKKRSEVFNANFVYFILISSFVAIRILANVFEIGTVAGYLFNSFIQIALMFGLSIFLYSYLNKQKIKKTFTDYNFNKISGKAIFYSVLIGFLVYGLTICISSFFSYILKSLGYDPSYGVSSSITSYSFGLFLLNILTTAILPGFCEEVAHRGMLINAYKQMGYKKAIYLSAILFGLMHLNIEQFFYATLVGVLFGFVAIGTSSIYPSMIMHFMNNAISVFMGYASVNKLKIIDYITAWQTSLQTMSPMISFLVIFSVIFFMLGLLIFLVIALIKETSKNKIKEIADEIYRNKLRDQLFEGTSIEEKADNEPKVIFNSPNGNVGKINFDLAARLGFITKIYKPKSQDKIFLIGSIVLCSIVTIMTFI